MNLITIGEAMTDELLKQADDFVKGQFLSTPENMGMQKWAEKLIKVLSTKVREQEELLDCRAGRLLKRNVSFFVVKASESYAEKVVELIKQQEGDNWTDQDELWAKQTLTKPTQE